MNFILALFQSKLARQIGAFALMAIAFMAALARSNRKGVIKERQRQKEGDRTRAEEIDDSVNSVRRVIKLRPDDKRGYRD